MNVVKVSSKTHKYITKNVYMGNLELVGLL